MNIEAKLDTILERIARRVHPSSFKTSSVEGVGGARYAISEVRNIIDILSPADLITLLEHKTKGEFTLARKEFTDDTDREWKLVGFTYSTPSDIRLTLNVGVSFETQKFDLAASPQIQESE